jgi:hypothetical protein
MNKLSGVTLLEMTFPYIFLRSMHNYRNNDFNSRKLLADSLLKRALGLTLRYWGLAGSGPILHN